MGGVAGLSCLDLYVVYVLNMGDYMTMVGGKGCGGGTDRHRMARGCRLGPLTFNVCYI